MPVKVRERTQGKGGWEVDIAVTLPDGTKVRKRLKSPLASKTASKRWGEERAQALALGQGAKPAKVATVPTFAEFAVEFLEHQAGAGGNKKTTQRSARSMFKFHLVPAFGALRLDQIDARAIAAYVTRKLSEKTLRNPTKTLAPKTIDNHIGLLGRALHVALEWKLITEAPKIKHLQIDESKFRFLDIPQAEVYLQTAREHAPDRWPLLYFAIRTGLRLSELRALCWRHVDLARRSVRVEIGYTDESGVGPPKNRKIRDIPLASDITAIMRTIRAEHPRHGDDLVFTGPDGERLTRGAVSHVAERVGRLAGFDSMHPHALRHTFASHAVMRGVPLVQVQRWLGHANIKMTCRYAHLSLEFGAEMIERLLPSWAPSVE